MRRRRPRPRRGLSRGALALGGDLKALTTSQRPSRALYRSSVAEALGAHEPFVVSFATPLFCQTRACGAVVDVVAAVAARHARVRFIHVEIYEGNDPEARFACAWA